MVPPGGFQWNWPCWPHVGTFFALGRLCFALGRFLNVFCIFLAHVGRFFRALDRSWLDFGAVRTGPGRVLEAPEAYFSRFYRTWAPHRANNVRF